MVKRVGAWGAGPLLIFACYLDTYHPDDVIYESAPGEGFCTGWRGTFCAVQSPLTCPFLQQIKHVE